MKMVEIAKDDGESAMIPLVAGVHGQSHFRKELYSRGPLLLAAPYAASLAGVE